jgi:hypothetical protein
VIILAIIKAPNEKYNGVSASLTFVNGKAETDEPWLIQWFKEHGYEVIEEEKEQSGVDLEKLTKGQIKAKLDELNIEYDSNDNKDVLLEKLKAATEKSE